MNKKNEIHDGDTWVVNMGDDVVSSYVHHGKLEGMKYAIKRRVSLRMAVILFPLFMFLQKHIHKTWFKITMYPVILTYNIMNKIMFFIAEGIQYGYDEIPGEEA